MDQILRVNIKVLSNENRPLSSSIKRMRFLLPIETMCTNLFNVTFIDPTVNYKLHVHVHAMIYRGSDISLKVVSANHLISGYQAISLS